MVEDCRRLSPKWERLSAGLGLPPSKIATIKGDYSGDTVGCWNKALSEWINQTYNTDRYGKPSWKTLLQAVAREDKLLFHELRQKHQGNTIILVKVQRVYIEVDI